MSPKRWQQIETVFQTAVDLAPAEREKYVSESCRDDRELQNAVENLIRKFEEKPGFIESPVWTDSAMFGESAKHDFHKSLSDISLNGEAADPLLDKTVGVYRLTRELGRGGMGAVYYATRADGEFRQSVAVKLIKRGMDSDFIVRRFRHERQILAALDHPNIARLLDGGTTTAGLPYFVMEYVEGEPLYNYADSRELNLNERLKLFAQICQAVSAAHEKQIIHRDIKPGNILVTREGVPKLLDFGIAKILDPELIHESINPTSTMMRLMTPDYASPEQVCGREVTPASDVYALGVLLYELLTGHRPYSFASRSPHEISRVICEVAPHLPSRIAASAEHLLPQYQVRKLTVEQSARQRRTTVAELQQGLSGTLDNILLKALCKDADGRYSSVSLLLHDINKYLRGETVSAEPCQLQAKLDDSVTTGEPIFAGRSLAVLPFKLLTQITDENTGDRFLGVGLADALIIRLSNIRRIIVRPTSSVLRYADSQTTQFDPISAGKELAVEFVLDGHIQKSNSKIRVSVQLLNVNERATVWAERFDENFTDVLSLEDVISTKVAEALIPKLSGDDREQLARRGTKNAEAFEAYLRGRYHWNTFTEDGFAKAILSFNQAVALDPDYSLAHAGIADYHIWLGIYGVLPPRECYAAAHVAARQAVELDEDSSEAHASLAHAVLLKNFNWALAETHCRLALELNPHNIAALVLYSRQLVMEGRFDEGLSLAQRAVELDPQTPFVSHNLGQNLYFSRRFDESLAQYQKTIETHSRYGIAFVSISWVTRYLGRHEESLIAIRRARELFDDSLFLLIIQGQAFAAAGMRGEAEQILNKLRVLAARRYVSPYQMALMHVFSGDKESALDALEAAFAEGEAWLAWMGVEPAFDGLRDELRFIQVLEQTGNPIFFRANTVELIGMSVTPQTQLLPKNTQPNSAAQSGESLKLAAKQSRLRGYAAISVALLIIAAVAAMSMYQNPIWQLETTGVTIQTVQKNQGAATNNNPISLAVAPFTTVGARTDDEQYLGVGTTDLVINKLSELKAINLRLASSVRRYLNQQKSPIEIGRELAVDFVVSGSIEKSGANVIARLDITEIRSGNVVWTETVTEPNSNLFELQDQISTRIAESLSLRLSAAEQQKLTKHFTENNQAHQLYLAGRYHFGKRTVEGLRQAIEMFEQAIRLDENFALAHAGASDCYALLNWYQEPPPADAWANAQKAAQKAVELDPNLAEAHVSLAFIKFHFERDYQSSEAEFKSAIALKPNYATAHQWYSFLLSSQARHIESIEEMREAERLEPRSAVIATAVGNVLFHARRYDESIEQIKRALEIDPGSISAHVILRWNYEIKNQPADAMAVFEKERAFAGDTPTTRAKLVRILAADRKPAEAKRVLAELAASRQIEQVTPYELAIIYALLDDKTIALDLLAKAKNQHAVGFSFIRVDPRLDNLRDDPRFVELLK